MGKMGGARPGSGRPKGSKNRATIAHRLTISEAAQSHTDVALQALVDIATRGESEAARVSAASHLLDRGYGRPPQSIETTVKGSDIRDLSTSDILSRIEAALSRIEGTAVGVGRPGAGTNGSADVRKLN